MPIPLDDPRLNFIEPNQEPPDNKARDDAFEYLAGHDPYFLYLSDDAQEAAIDDYLEFVNHKRSWMV